MIREIYQIYKYGIPNGIVIREIYHIYKYGIPDGIVIREKSGLIKKITCIILTKKAYSAKLLNAMISYLFL